MILPSEMQGMFVCDALNRLPVVLEDGEGCCPNCCAPCHALQILDNQGVLDEVVMQAPEQLWTLVSWFKDGKVDREWLSKVWGMEMCPCREDAL